ncbi:hypothetical protein TNCV_4809621 [Trichonephila clavipes]|nr:hypothetical protein TNCV_4809621 [Trichonephila clavipes]
MELDGTVESTDTIVKLKTKIENSSTFESDPDFVKTLSQNCIDERVSQNEREVTSEQKIELAKLQLAKLEKEIELQLAKNKALSLNPAAKVEEKQTLQRKISMRSTKDQLVKKDALMPVKHNVFLWNLPDVEESLSVPFFLYVSDSPLVSMEIPLRTAYSQAGRCGMQPKAKHSLRTQAHQSKSRTETVKTETLEKKLRIRERRENARGARAGVTF